MATERGREREMSDSREKDTEKKTSGVLDTAGQAAPHALSNTCGKPGGSQDSRGQARALGTFSTAGRFSALCPTPSPPASSSEGPSTPSRWRRPGWGRAAEGKDQARPIV